MILEATLVSKAKNGDKDAFAELYSLVWQELYKTAYYTLGNREDAEDVVSETFMEGYKGISALRDDNAFKSWIFRILNARCKRKIATYYKLRLNSDYDELDESLSNDVSYAKNSDEKIALVEALEKLNFDERNIVTLFAVNGYKIAEISEMLDCPQGTISSKIHRTLKKLRNYLERE